MEKQVWDGCDWVKSPMCENAARNTDVNYGRGIGIQQCYDEAAQFTATVDYSYAESDQMKLCSSCLAALKKSCRRNGYKLKSTRLKS